MVFFSAAFSLKAEPKLALVTFQDGYEVQGYADITKKEKIEFRFDLDETPDTYDEFDVKRINFLEEPFASFEFVDIYNGRFKLLKIITEGAIVVYAQFPEPFSTQKSYRQKAREDYLNGEFKRSGGYSVKGEDGKTYTFYGDPIGQKNKKFFIKRKGQVQAIDIKLGFKKRAVKFFKDCPYLVEIIENKEWKYKDMQRIVDYYNEMCSE